MERRMSIDAESLCAGSPRLHQAAVEANKWQVIEPHTAAQARGTRGELRKLFSLALPLIFQNTFGYLISIMSVAFVGHLGSDVLSSVVLASSLYNVTGLSIIIGLAAGMETLCGQAYGGRNFKMLGLVLQRAVAVCMTACIPIFVLWFNMGPVLVALRQSPDVAVGATRYLQLVSPSLAISCMSSTLNRYLVAQRVAAPSTYCSFVAACLCPVYNYLLIFQYRLGLDGAAYANCLSQATNMLFLLGYVCYRDITMLGKPESTWPGIQLLKALEPRAVVQYLGYGGAAAAMICLEWWAFEVIIILAGTIPGSADVAVSTMGITFNICALLYMLSMSFGTAVNTRVANELGAGNALGARFSLRVALSVVAMMQVFFAVSLWFLRGYVAHIFTDAQSVVDSVDSVMPILCASVIGDGLNALFSGVMRGCGRQGLGAYLNLFGWWGVVVPLAVLLGLHYQQGPWGFNLALAIGTTMQAVVFMTVTTRLDWDREARRAKELIASHDDHAEGEDEMMGAEDRGHGATDGLEAPLLSHAVNGKA